MKKRHTWLVCLLLAAMLLTLTACGEKEPADPNLVKVGDYTVLYKGASIMTDDEGKDAVVLTLDYTNNSKDPTAYWVAIYEKAFQDGIQLDMAMVYVSEDSFTTVTEDKFTEIDPGKTFEVHTAFVLRDASAPVEVKFSDLFEKKGGTITIDPTTLKRETPEAETPAVETGLPDEADETAAETAPTGDALLDWWNGQWYGWWIATGGDGEYEKWSNRWWDCCAVIDIDSDYSGTVEIWDQTEPRGDGVSYAGVSLNAAGISEHGTLTSEDGWFLWSDLGHADWIVDPGILEYDNMICIDGWYEDEDGSFHYAMYLRPWGTIWDDVDADNLPQCYESWYLPLVNAGKSMPDTIGEESQTGVSEDEVNPQGEADPGQTDTATDADYGKSNPNAEGLATLEAMQALYKKCYENRNEKHLFTYEDAREALGSDGVVRKAASFSWNETKHTYRWETADGADYFNISFELEDGEEWYYSCNFSDNVKNNLW